MMPSPLGISLPGTAYPSYTTDAVFEDPLRQIPASQESRRLSRGSSGQRTGKAMRVVKPRSANNSPGSSMGAGRRRTFVNDGALARRRQQVIEQVVLPLPGIKDPAKRSPRPASWHPASCHIQQPQMQTQQPLHQFHLPSQARCSDDDIFTNFHQISPRLTTYSSCHTSPSTFSPLSLPYHGVETTPFGPRHECWNLPLQQTQSYASPALESTLSYPESFPPLSTGSCDGPRSSSMTARNSFVLNGLDETSPQTPENLPRVHEPRTPVSEESIPYQPLEEPEEEGEILVGMGLYDAPDKYDADLELNNYRSTLSSLLGGSRGQESPGKGLKLEEMWQPPESEDEEDEEGDEAEDESNLSS